MSSKNTVAELEGSSSVSSEFESLNSCSKRVEQRCQELVEKAIREHLAMGRPIYFRDPQGRLVKEMPNGRRFEVRVLYKGQEVIVHQLSTNESRSVVSRRI
jgi:hypothetical protein